MSVLERVWCPILEEWVDPEDCRLCPGFCEGREEGEEEFPGDPDEWCSEHDCLECPYYDEEECGDLVDLVGA